MICAKVGGAKWWCARETFGRITNANWTVPDDNAAVKVGMAHGGARAKQPHYSNSRCFISIVRPAGRFMTSALHLSFLCHVCSFLLSFYERS